MSSSASRHPGGRVGPARAAGTRSALDRLVLPADPVADITDTRPHDITPADTGPPEIDPAEPAADAARSTGGWGVTAMPSWLDADVDTDGRRDGDRRDGDVRGDDRDRPHRTGVGARDAYADDADLDADDEFPRRRIGMAPPAALVIILVGVLACVFAGYSLMHDRSVTANPVAFPGSAGPTDAASRTAGAPGASSTGTTDSGTRDSGTRDSGTRGDTGSPPTAAPSVLVVSVVGLVKKPGLVRLRPDARVADAIDRAGGAREGADLLSLNLAQPLRDGDQILVGYTGGGGRMSMRSNVVSAGGTAAAAPTAAAGGPSGGASSASGGGAGSVPGGKVNLNSATEAQLDTLPGVGPVTAKAIIAWRDENGRFTSVDQLGEVDGIGPARLSRLRELVTV